MSYNFSAHFIHILLIIIKTNCDSNETTVLIAGGKSVPTFLRPILTVNTKLWDRKSCLTYRTTIGTCMTLDECQYTNGTVVGLCLGLYLICCDIDPNAVKRAQILSINSMCNKTEANKTGVCLPADHCRRRMGAVGAYCMPYVTNCCQLDSNCGKTITHNETVFVNDHYPMATTDSNVCQVVVHRPDNVCQIRLEFLVFNISQPDIHGKCTTDALIIKSPVGEQTPIICGENSGQHLYLDMGRKETKKPIKLSIVTNGHQWERKWMIRFIMIGCDSPQMAPTGCLQYFIRGVGIVRSFNYGKSITGLSRYMSNTSYTVCVRVEDNHCWIQWEPEYEDTFSWGQQVLAKNGPTGLPVGLCNGDDFVVISDGIKDDKSPEEDRICGHKLSHNNYIMSKTKPFTLKVRSNENHTLNAYHSQHGFSLKYTQIACTDVTD